MGKSEILKSTGSGSKGYIHEWIWPHIVMGCCGLQHEGKHLWRNSWVSPKCSRVKGEWVQAVVECPNVHLDFFFFLNPDFKSQSSPWMKGCPPNYRVQRGNHLLCCPPPTMLGGLVRPRREEAWFSRSRSSRLWPVLYCRGRITRSCQSPSETQADNVMNKKTGNNH